MLTEADGPMMLRDLAASAGMTAAKAHPYMVSYCASDLLSRTVQVDAMSLGRSPCRWDLPACGGLTRSA